MTLEIRSRLPAGSPRATPLLFVHGAWHAAWCWDVHFLEFFAAHGYAAHAVSLRGHGMSAGRENLRWARLSGYVEDVARAAATLPGPPVVIGHSMGGMVVQKYLENHSAPAGVLLASAPPRGVLATTLRIARRHPLLFARVNLTLSLLPLVATPDLAHEAFFSPDLDDDLVRDYAGRLQDESYLGFLDMLALDLPRPAKIRAPMLVLGGARDTIFHVHEIEATARACRTRAEMFPDIAHDMMLEARWKQPAQRILAWLETLPIKEN